MKRRAKKKAPILCCRNGKWKEELDRRLQTDDRITLMSLGGVKAELLRHLHRRKDIEILKMETKYMKKREKGMGLKVIVRSRKQADATKEEKA